MYKIAKIYQTSQMPDNVKDSYTREYGPSFGQAIPVHIPLLKNMNVAAFNSSTMLAINWLLDNDANYGDTVYVLAD